MRTRHWLAIMVLSLAVLRVSAAEDQRPFELTTLLGETFHGCRIIKATPDAVTISHDSGVSRIPFDNLNDEWKKLFHYNPEKARAFQREESERRALAEEKRKRAQREFEELQTRQMNELAKAAENRPTLAERLAQQQVETAATAAAAVASQPGILVPLPGDPTPYLGGGSVATTRTTSSGHGVQSTVEIAIPATSPITQIYTPGATGGQRYIINQGAVFAPGDGSVYYINPGYVNPGYVTPPSGHSPIVVYPPGTVKPVAPVRPVPTPRGPGGGNIQIGGGGVIRLGP